MEIRKVGYNGEFYFMTMFTLNMIINKVIGQLLL